MFIMAWWSAPARLAWKLLRETLDRLDPEERIELVVVDIDRATNLFKHPSIDRASAGAGEIAWVISGRVVKFSIDPFHHPDEVEHLTKWLLWRGPAQ
jgi:hypothetical protein